VSGEDDFFVMPIIMPDDGVVRQSKNWAKFWGDVQRPKRKGVSERRGQGVCVPEDI
jgi:hypothetical protein